MFNVSLLNALKPIRKNLEVYLGNFSVDTAKKEEKALEAETDELLVLKGEVPKLINNGAYDDAEGVISYFTDRNPTSAEGFVLLAELYKAKGDWKSVVLTYYAAKYNEPDNITIDRYIDDAEEQLLSLVYQIPLKYKEWMFFSETRPYNDIDHRIKYQIVQQGKYFRVLSKYELQPGELVLRSKPFVLTPYLTPDRQLFSTCFYCLRERSNIEKAHSCPIRPHNCPFVFCSFDCLINNVRMHSLECQLIPIIIASSKECGLELTLVLHIFRAIIKAFLERDFKSPDLETLEEIFQLSTFYNFVKLAQKDVLESVKKLAKCVIMELESSIKLNLTEKELIELMLILLSHSLKLNYDSPSAAFQMANPEISHGLAFCPLLAKFNHSCNPSCSYNFDDDGQISIRALYKIPPGGILCVSLVKDLFLPHSHRKNLTANPKIFGCGCSRCANVVELDKNVRSIRCKKCVRGFFFPLKSEALSVALKLYDAVALEVKQASTFSFLSKSMKETENWSCTICGNLNDALSKECINLEKILEQIYFEAEHLFIEGHKVEAKNIFKSIVDRYSHVLHPNHRILFNSNVYLAGFYSQNPDKSIPDSLKCIRRAVIAAENVLPISNSEKIHLLLFLVKTTFSYSNLEKLCKRGDGVSPSFIFEPLYAALWHSNVIKGSSSYFSIAIMQRLRVAAATFNKHSPPSTKTYRILMAKTFEKFVKAVINNSALSLEKMISDDPCLPVFAAAELGFIGGSEYLQIFKIFYKVKELSTGLTLIGLAARRGHVEFVKKLLDNNFLFLDTNELGVSALLAMSAQSLPGNSKREDEKMDEAQAKILRLFYHKACEIDRMKNIKNQTKMQLIRATTIECLGLSNSLHYACARGKPALVSQLVRLGCPVYSMNRDGSTGLHLASLCGHTNVIEKLLQFNAEVNSQTISGETPLMLASYGLNSEAVFKLLENGADAKIVGSNLNVLHALVLGVLRVNNIAYKNISTKDEPFSIALHGFSDRFFGSIYKLGLPHLSIKNYVILQYPFIESESDELLIYPQIILDRLQKGIAILELLSKFCSIEMYFQKTDTGYSPCDLLLHLWERFWLMCNTAYNKFDLRIAAWSAEQQAVEAKTWSIVLKFLNRLVSMLRADNTIINI